MPFCKRIVRPVQVCRFQGEGRTPSVLDNLVDVSSFTLGNVLRQLSALAREAVSVLEEIELEIGSVCHRALLLEVRIIGLHRYVSALSLRPATHCGSNLDQESKRTAHFKSSWQQNINVFDSSSRPPCVEELHQEAQLNLQSLLQEEFGEPVIQKKATANTFGHKPALNREAVPDSCPKKGEKRMEFVLMPSTRSSSEDETTTFGVKPHEQFLSSPSTPDKPPKWTRGIPQSTPEKKRWHQARTVQADLVPINVTGEAVERQAIVRHSLFNTETAVNPKSTLRRRRTITGLCEPVQPQPGSLKEGLRSPHALTKTEANQRLFTFDEDMNVMSGNQVGNLGMVQSFPPTLRKVQSDLGQINNSNLSQSSGNITFTMNNPQMMPTSISEHSFSSLNTSWDQMRGSSFSSSLNNSSAVTAPSSVSVEALHDGTHAPVTFSQTYSSGQSHGQRTPCSSAQGSSATMSDRENDTESPHSSSRAWNGSNSVCSPHLSDMPPTLSLQCLKHSSQQDSGVLLNDGSHKERSVPLSTFLPREGQRQNTRSPMVSSFTSTPGEAADKSQNHKDTRTNHERIIIYPINNASEDANSNLEFPGYANAEACTFRERSLSTPTDSGSCCSSDAIRSYDSKHYDHTRRHSANYIMRYPSASSEESQSNENVSVMTDQEGSQKSRPRTRSISLKKPKKKPVPPVRNVSLKTCEISLDPEETSANSSPQENRPTKLFIPPEKQVIQSESVGSNESSGFVSDAHSSSTTPTLRDGEPIRYTEHWFLNDWKSNDPYRSLSNSSTTTGITVIECVKSRGSSESLASPSISRATTPSQLSVEAESKMSSPGKLPGLMSPSSGYSSQSETPTTYFPMSVYQGHVPQPGGKAKPKVPERKSSLQPTSPNEKSPKSKRIFELPISPPPHLDLSGLLSFKSKSKASRRHSDSSNSNKPSQKHSPNQPSMPVITQTVLESVRLRSVSRSENEDHTEFVEPPQITHSESSEAPLRKVRPPVPGKPPMSKRPSSIALKLSPIEHPSPASTVPSPVSSNRGFSTVFRKVGVKKQDSLDKPDSQKLQASPNPAHVQPNHLQSNYVDNKQSRSVPLTTRDETQRLCSTELTRSSTQYVEKKKSKTPPPVPKKPNVLIVPTNTAHILVVTERAAQGPLHKKTVSACHDNANAPFTIDASNVERGSKAHDLNMGPNTRTVPSAGIHLEGNRNVEYNDGTGRSQTVSLRTDLDQNPEGNQRSTEDLFTVIHRSKRKVLGWKEPGESFTVRQVAISPPKPIVPIPSAGIRLNPSANGNGSKTSTSNENFKALLQKKGSKPAGGARMSAAELLKSTNPLARRIATEFTQDSERCQPISEPGSPENASKC
ncbi:NHS-like protein 2 isoform X2 [Leucoraja erinacea]|uniref:NHS-like protein 2 isoform X2 n=1 Tax=Leucoraja erinaceus TaxID=7782 RepID=UPI0024567954|nr:NHS-like protein 2 isoform X2 [Leucoraja erinacea]